MTESERDLLMPFLRKLVQTRGSPGDEAANTLIQAALGKQPNAIYLLVQRALTVESELAAAQRRICALEGKTAPEAMTSPAVDFLNPTTAGWGGAMEQKSTVSSSKKMYDFFKDAHSGEGMDLESRAVSFIGNHSGKIWLFILALAAVVVTFR